MTGFLNNQLEIPTADDKSVNVPYLSLVMTSAGQTSKEERKECGEDLSESHGSVGHNDLPYM